MNETSSTILVVEDEEAVLLTLGDSLKQRGFNVLTAKDGKEGLGIAIDKHPDIIVTDLRMPIMTGLEMIKELRKDAWGKSANVIILTNVSDAETLGEAMSEDAFHYIVKGDSSLEGVVDKIVAKLKV